MPSFLLTELEYFLRIALAVVCGGVIGFERERRFKSAGIRTHLIVSLSSALMVVVSKYGFLDVAGQVPGATVDVARVAAGVVSAVGFLGAGVIFIRKDTVNGVTTGAGLWATVGVGIAVGCGMYLTGIAATALIMVIQVVLHRDNPLVKHPRMGSAVLLLEEDRVDADHIRQLLDSIALQIDSVVVQRAQDNWVEVRCEVVFSEELDANDLLDAIRVVPELRSVEMHQAG